MAHGPPDHNGTAMIPVALLPKPRNGLTAGEIVEVVAWKLRLRWRHAVDQRGAYARFMRQGDRWAASWNEKTGARPASIRDWLRRPGAGAFWFPVEDAANWARATCTPADLAIAEAAVKGTVDLLGATSASDGRRPLWRQDLYSGVEWPLVDGLKLNPIRDDGSDIRTVWELSRSYHFLPLARAFWKTGDPRFQAAFVEHVESWIAANPLGYGPNWASAMDIALRASNWVVGAALFAGAEGIPEPFWRRLLAHLYATGLFLERYPEWHPVYRGNHYVAHAVGQLYLGAWFRDDPVGWRWLETGADALNAEMQRQVQPDGVSFEGSLAYHRLVTELFTYGGEIIRLNAPERRSDAFAERLRLMYRFIAAYTSPTGDAPMLGDADDGRVHAVSAESMGFPRKHKLGLRDDFWPAEEPAPAAFPQGGYYVLGDGNDRAVVRCGPVGLLGAGCHDHNDQLAFELVLGGRRVVADSGSYAYTRDLHARHAFRSTAAHSVVQLDGEEQNPILVERPWRVLRDRTRAECTRWEITPEMQCFAGRHFGFADRLSGAVVSRTIVARPRERKWEVIDEVGGTGAERVTWRLHLGACIVRRGADPCTILLPGQPDIALRIQAPPELALTLTESAASDKYGSRHVRPCIVLSGLVSLPVRIKVEFTIEAP